MEPRVCYAQQEPTLPRPLLHPRARFAPQALAPLLVQPRAATAPMVFIPPPLDRPLVLHVLLALLVPLATAQQHATTCVLGATVLITR